MNDYESKKLDKIERLRKAAEKAKKESDATWKEADKMASVIPFGQPILVGHHSEGRDRRYRSRIDGKRDKAVELDDKAAYYERRVDAMENNRAISGDNPNAIELLREKLERLRYHHSLMVECNKLVRKGDSPKTRTALLELLGKQDLVDEMFVPDFMGRIGFARYHISNSSQNIKSVEKRISQLEKRSQEVTTEVTTERYRIVDNVEDNRIQVFFTPRPNKETCRILGRNGFRWTPSIGAWQAYRSKSLEYAQSIVDSAINDI